MAWRAAGGRARGGDAETLPRWDVALPVCGTRRRDLSRSGPTVALDPPAAAHVIRCPPPFPPGLLACPSATSSKIIPYISRGGTSSQLPTAPSQRSPAGEMRPKRAPLGA